APVLVEQALGDRLLAVEILVQRADADPRQRSDLVGRRFAQMPVAENASRRFEDRAHHRARTLLLRHLFEHRRLLLKCELSPPDSRLDYALVHPTGGPPWRSAATAKPT